METVDVIVAGGGPAGSTAASLLAAGGLKTLVLEKDRFPRFHVGESMLPQSVRIWDRIGVLPKLHGRFLLKYGARFFDAIKNRVAQYRFTDAFDPTYDYSFQVPRAEFDDLLLRHAEERGAAVREGWEVRGVLWEGERALGVVARDPDGRDHEIRARVVVDATGRDTIMASRRRIKRRYPGMDNTALFSHFDGVARQSGREEGTLDIVVFEHGWMWNIPFKTGVNSCGMAVNGDFFRARDRSRSLDQFFDDIVSTTEVSRAIYGKATKRNPVRALADFSYRVDRYGGDGWVIIGDAAGFIDPLFSTGAHLAFVSGEMAADKIVETLGAGDDVTERSWAEYERLLRHGTDMFLGGVQSFYRGELLERIFEDPQRRVIRQSITSMLCGDVFDTSVAWARFMKQQCPPALPGDDATAHPSGASPVLDG